MYSSAYARTRPLDPNGGFRLGVFDTSVLTSDITAALKRGKPSSILAGMRYGTLRGFIPHYVWAEVPRVLADRRHEGGDFDLVKAERLWWGQYVPLLHVVDVNGLPLTEAADKLAQEDLSDVGILQLAGVLAPVVLLAADRDLIRHDVAVRDWPALRAVLGKIGAAEHAVRGSTAAMELSGRSLVETARLARAYPMATGALSVAAGIYVYRNRARLPRARATLSKAGMEVVQFLAEPFARHELHTATWMKAERGVPGDDVLSLVARLLAREPTPMTRTDILSALPAAAQRPHRRQMDGLGRLLHRFPAFHQPAPGKWQLGRANMQITAPPWA
ncbi:PIN domain-containing protein [Streptomyces beigongshangae]|uniref:PIN domain-containing protein n=1 Tax=Streptomyces beigongshangae TaxID=2841597 RepID=UPI001C842285|nr:PIN domain-containing protein [Streptomyces sp. REN17]